MANEDRLLEIASFECALTDVQLTEVSELVKPLKVDETLFVEDDTVGEDQAPLDKNQSKSEGKKPEDIRQILSNASLPQKIKFALLGNATCRALLIRDTNKMIQQFVLKNPRMQPSEIVEFAKNPNLSELVLRAIGNNTTWMKAYSAKVALMFNPKTPQDIGLKWLKFLNAPEIRRLAKSKNIPNVISVAARKRLSEMESK